MNAQEKRNADALFRVHFKLQRVRVRDDFRQVVHEAYPDEGILNTDHDHFFNKYAGRKVLVIQDGDNEWCILEDNNYILPTAAFKFHQ